MGRSEWWLEELGCHVVGYYIFIDDAVCFDSYVEQEWKRERDWAKHNIDGLGQDALPRVEDGNLGLANVFFFCLAKLGNERSMKMIWISVDSQKFCVSIVIYFAQWRW